MSLARLLDNLGYSFIRFYSPRDRGYRVVIRNQDNDNIFDKAYSGMESQQWIREDIAERYLASLGVTVISCSR